jgi:hypothetical protein
VYLLLLEGWVPSSGCTLYSIHLNLWFYRSAGTFAIENSLLFNFQVEGVPQISTMALMFVQHDSAKCERQGLEQSSYVQSFSSLSNLAAIEYFDWKPLPSFLTDIFSLDT